MKKRGKTYKLSFFTMVLVMVIGLSLNFVITCQPARDITIENSTSLTLVIFSGSTKVTTLEPGEQIVRYWALTPEEFLISAKDLSGTTVYSKKWTVDELFESHWKVVITSP